MLLGPAVGSALYDAGGFKLPFLSVGSVALAIAILLLFIIPNVRPDVRDKADGGKSLTFAGLAKVRLIVYTCNFINFDFYLTFHRKLS